MSSSNSQIDAFREQVLNAAKNKVQLSIEGGGSKAWYGNPNQFTKLNTRSYSGILEYQPEELVITACAGTPLQEIEAALEEKNQVLAFEHLTLVSMLLLAVRLLQGSLVLVASAPVISATLF